MEDKNLMGIRYWQDVTLGEADAGQMKIYRENGVYLGLQECIENRNQASGAINFSGNTLIFLRYLRAGSARRVESSLISLLLTQEFLYSVHQDQGGLAENVSKILLGQLGGPSFEAKRILLIFFEEAEAKTRTQVKRLCQLVERMRSEYRESGELAEEQNMLTLLDDLQEALNIVNGQQRILRELQCANLASDGTVYAQQYVALHAKLVTLDEWLRRDLGWLAEARDVRRQELLRCGNESLRSIGKACWIFLPIIFIASLYAMRFKDMSELESAYGYPICLTVMAAAALFGWLHGNR